MKFFFFILFLFALIFCGLGILFGDNPLRNGDIDGNGALENKDWNDLKKFIQGVSATAPTTIDTITEVDGEARGCDFTSRYVRSEPVAGEFIVDDCCTKLTYASLPEVDLVPLTMTEALAEIAALNAASYGGFSDWRLPTGAELYSLVHFGDDSEPAIAGEFVEIVSLLTDLSLSISEEAVWSGTGAVDQDVTPTIDESLRTQKLLPRIGAVAPFLTDPMGSNPLDDEAILLPVRGGTL